MQSADKDSIMALAGMSPLEGLLRSHKHSNQDETWIVDGQVAAISGISQATMLSNWACPWLLCSDIIRKHPRIFLEETKKWTYDKLAQYGTLRNYVDVRHTRSIKWLKWLGYTLYPPQPIGKNGELFMLDELKDGR